MNSITFVVLFFCAFGSFVQTKYDSAAIKETVLNYIEGFFKSDPQRMSKAIHPELAKRIIVRDSSGYPMIQNMGASQLILGTKRNRNTNILNPDKPFQAEIIIYDIFNNVATVKATTNQFRFIDYIHLAKFGSDWKIVNVLWEYTN